MYYKSPESSQAARVFPPGSLLITRYSMLATLVAAPPRYGLAIQVTTGGPFVTPELPGGVAGPLVGAALGSVFGYGRQSSSGMYRSEYSLVPHLQKQSQGRTRLVCVLRSVVSPQDGQVTSKLTLTQDGAPFSHRA